MEQHYNSNPLPLQQVQQTQMTPLNNILHMQSPFLQQVYNSPFNNMTWTSSVAAYSSQSSLTVTMTPSTINIVTSTFATLQSSQSRTLNTELTTLHDQYGSFMASQHRPLHDMCSDYPMYGTTLPPLPPSLQVLVLCIPKFTIYINHMCPL